MVMKHNFSNWDLRKIIEKKYPVKIRAFTRASANVMHHYLRHLLQKCPDTIILHGRTNNCVCESSRAVRNKILNLKTLIENTLPKYGIIISNGKASLTVENLNDHF